MEPFILEDMNELEAAKVMIGGLLASGQVKDRRDFELLDRRPQAARGAAQVEVIRGSGGVRRPLFDEMTAIRRT